jgi:hypothetical protein
MRKLVALVFMAVSFAAFPATAGALPPHCEATACTDPVGTVLGPLGLDKLIEPRP